MAVFTPLSPTDIILNPIAVTDTLLPPDAGIVIDAASLRVAGGQSSIGLYDGSLTPLGIRTVSADALFDVNLKQPYFKVQIEVTPEGMQLIRQHQIRPGMPAEVFIRTGERTLMNYLFKPLRDRFRSALTEE